MKIQITQQHIDDAIRWRNEAEKRDGVWKEITRNCPVAQAVGEKFGEEVVVGLWDVWFPKTGKYRNLIRAGSYTKAPSENWESLRPGVIEVEDV